MEIAKTYWAEGIDENGTIKVRLGFDLPSGASREAATVIVGRPAYLEKDEVGKARPRFLELDDGEAEVLATVLHQVLTTGRDSRVEVPFYGAPLRGSA